jgi:hypothetical protein
VKDKKMSLTGEAIKYLQQTYPNADFLKDIILQDDGEGPYIKYWGIGSPKPTEEEINLASNSMVPKWDKPSIEERFQLLYNDQKNGTTTYSKRIDDIGKPK